MKVKIIYCFRAINNFAQAWAKGKHIYCIWHRHSKLRNFPTVSNFSEALRPFVRCTTILPRPSVLSRKEGRKRANSQSIWMLSACEFNNTSPHAFTRHRSYTRMRRKVRGSLISSHNIPWYIRPERRRSFQSKTPLLLKDYCRFYSHLASCAHLSDGLSKLSMCAN